MANSEHLTILKQGIEVWNKWRKNNPTQIPDLSNADLSGLELIKGNFSNTNLSGVNFKATQLCNALFISADLKKANLSRSNIVGSDFSNADLRKADFTYANAIGDPILSNNVIFKNAKIQGTNFESAQLNNADFTKTKAGLPIFSYRAIVIVFTSILIGLWSAFPAFIMLTFNLYFFKEKLRENFTLLLFEVGILSIIWATFIRLHVIINPQWLIDLHIGIGTALIAFIVLSEFIALKITKSNRVFDTKLLFATSIVSLILVIIFLPTEETFSELEQVFYINGYYKEGQLGKALFGAFVGAVYGAWVCHSAITRKHFNWLWRVYIENLVCVGTSFKKATLDNAIFDSSSLTSANFSNASINRTTWWNVEDLDCIVFGETYLQYSQIRQIFQSYNGVKREDIQLDNLDLEGINLSGKNLCGASLIRTNLSKSKLSNSNLTDANFSDANLNRADLTGACLTGAILKDLNYDEKTIFKDVICDYIFFNKSNYSVNSRPFPSAKKFEHGDFENFFKKENNLKLVIRNTDDLQAIHHAFLKIINNCNIDSNNFRGIKRAGKYFLVEFSVSQNTNKALIEQIFEQELEQSKNQSLNYENNNHNDNNLLITNIISIIEKISKKLFQYNLKQTMNQL